MNTEKEAGTKEIAALKSGPPHPIDDKDDFIPRYLLPEQTRLFRSPMGTVRLEIRDEVCYPRVTVRRILPLSHPQHYISLWVGDEVEIGIIRSPSDLDAESQKIIHEEIDKRYFTPVIKAIHRVKERFGVHQWEVETSRGNATFFVQGLHQNVKQVPPSRIIVTDVRGNRYDIPDYHELDPHSFRRIQRHL